MIGFVLAVACAEPRTIDSDLPDRQWALDVSVCLPGAAARCADAEWQTVCAGDLVTVPYRECWTPAGGGVVDVRFSAEPVKSACDLEGRIVDTWDALARGVSASGCDSPEAP